MPRIVNRPVAVSLGTDARPAAFRDGRRPHRVARVLDVWREAGDWWAGEGERTVFRAETDGGRVVELEYRHGERRWYLYKTYD